ncbi:hypothetical protein [Pyrobaculum sp.]|uniref:hypothetical protein n=1 Tax=Pyrobaculum sp. TaxID=2004705 RepID=UPI00316FE256
MAVAGLKLGWSAVLLALSLLVAAAYGQPPGNTPADVGFICATAGELGLAGEPPVLAFSVFEKGVWKPAEAFVEPEDVAFLLVPLLTGDKPEKGVVQGQLPPPVLKNETTICFKPGRGAPRAKPPAEGKLAVVKKRGEVYHVFITRPEAAPHANFSISQMGKPQGERPDEVKTEGALPKSKPRGGGEAEAQLTTGMTYWASFKLYSSFNKVLGLGQCAVFEFDVPAETADAALVLLGGTTPGTYSYYVEKWQNGAKTATYSGQTTVYSGSPQTVAVWMGGGRATYKGRICNPYLSSAAVYTAALVRVVNQQQYLRQDTTKMPKTHIHLSTSFDSKPPANPQLLRNSYVAVPGFLVDAASQITVDVYLRVLKSKAASTLYVYWEPLYLGSITGYTDPTDSNYLVFQTRITIPSSLYMYLLPTNGLGGVISIGPVDASPGFDAEVRIWTYVQRPVELAPAGDYLYRDYYTKRFRETTLVFHDVVGSAPPQVALMADLEYIAMSDGNYMIILNTKPLVIGDWTGKTNFVKLRYYIKGFDSNSIPVGFSVAVGPVYKLGSNILLEILQYISAALSYYDLAKSTLDALKGARVQFPIVGYITLLLSSYVSSISTNVIGYYDAGRGAAVLEFYTGGYNEPLTTYWGLFPSIRSVDTVVVTGVDLGLCDSISCYWFNIFSADGPSMPITTLGQGSVSGYVNAFPYRTLMCGIQEIPHIRDVDKCLRQYFR